jgi:tryptophan synthase, alpha subunit
LDTTEKLVKVLEKNGADCIELGMPFSDPIADGPTIQRASLCALKRGITVKKFLDLVTRLRKKTAVPLVMMTYYNPIYHYGLEKFAHQAKASGLDGVIVPDLPPEEARELHRNLSQRGLSQIFLVSPVTRITRIRKIVRMSSGFVYYVSLTGVTGARAALPHQIATQLRTIKQCTALPVCVGFGVSTPEQVKQLSAVADGVIVGSAIITHIEKHRNDRALYDKIGTYIGAMNKQTY